MLDRLRGLGIEITEDDVRAAAPAPPRPAARTSPTRWSRWASSPTAPRRSTATSAPGGPAYVDRYAAPLEARSAPSTEAGGVTVIAHPWGRGGLGRPDEATFAALHEIGLAGIEVDHQDHDAATRERLRAIARDLDLVVTGSSDYHGTGQDRPRPRLQHHGAGGVRAADRAGTTRPRAAGG